MEHLDINLLDWSRLQFALTACYHWIFVPLTLGLGMLIAIMETKYFLKGDLKWKKYTQFWSSLFAVNFAMGVATGIILEFQFGTNWSNYSWYVGDIFGAPLAIEGIFAFFLEATFMAVMLFGWDKVSKKFHLFSTWMVASGACLSALWILVANAWMQNPVGMHFNPDMVRNEMISFTQVALSSTAIIKFTHTVISSFVLGAAFMFGVSAWYLLKKRAQDMARLSIKVASSLGLVAILLTIATGDSSAVDVAKYQPMKFAAMEGLYQGQTHAPLTLFAILNSDKTIDNDVPVYYGHIYLPNALSLLATRNASDFVPGITDLIKGNSEQGIISTQEKMTRGAIARQKLAEYQSAKKAGDTATLNQLKQLYDRNTLEGQNFYNDYFQYSGYAYFDKAEESIPPVALVFYSFRLMVIIGFAFILIMILGMYYSYSDKRWTNLISLKSKWNRIFLYFAIAGIPFAYICSMSGWIVAEVGRQPWIVQNLLPTRAALSNIHAGNVKATFFIFACLFTFMLIAEFTILIKLIKKGPEEK